MSDPAKTWYDYKFSPWRVKGDARIVTVESRWKKPTKWDRQMKAAGENGQVFCDSRADVFENWQGPMLDAHGKHLWIHPAGTHGPLPDGISDERAIRAGHRLQTMSDVRARLCRLIDATPNLDWVIETEWPENTRDPKLPKIDWVIIGGERGPKARPCNVEWIRDLVRQCKAAGVPVWCPDLGLRELPEVRR